MKNPRSRNRLIVAVKIAATALLLSPCTVWYPVEMVTSNATNPSFIAVARLYGFMILLTLQMAVGIAIIWEGLPQDRRVAADRAA